MTSPTLVLSGLFIYPVKGCRGIAVPAAEVDALGLIGDRRFLIVDPTGKFLTQRSHPRMALIGTSLDDDHLTLSTPRAESELRVPRASDPAAPLMEVQVWGSHGLLAEDCGTDAAAWVSQAFQTPARLVRAGAAYHRPVKPSKAQPGDVVSFADAYPFLVISEATLADLNTRLVARGEHAVPMNRFRPNLVIAGAPPFGEDAWTRFQIGQVSFRTSGTCQRCIVTTTDQDTALRGKEPLRTLATYRRDPAEPTEIIFGQNVIHETRHGSLRVGDTEIIFGQNVIHETRHGSLRVGDTVELQPR